MTSSEITGISKHRRRRRRDRPNTIPSPVSATGVGSSASSISEGVRHASVGCIIADVDSFKEINDTFGHDVGDVVLQMVGRLFASKVRSGQQVIRYGGDEFVVAMSGVDLAAASGFAERLRVAASDLDWAAVAPGLQVTVSLGVACGLASRWQAVFVAADAQLLAAKRRGRNTVMAAPV